MPCPTDSTWLKYGEHCYKIFSEIESSTTSWWNARRLCHDEGGELASVHTYEENYWLLSKVRHDRIIILKLPLSRNFKERIV